MAEQEDAVDGLLAVVHEFQQSDRRNECGIEKGNCRENEVGARRSRMGQ